VVARTPMTHSEAKAFSDAAFPATKHALVTNAIEELCFNLEIAADDSLARYGMNKIAIAAALVARANALGIDPEALRIDNIRS
jgi:hypothetical protein